MSVQIKKGKIFAESSKFYKRAAFDFSIHEDNQKDVCILNHCLLLFVNDFQFHKARGQSRGSLGQIDFLTCALSHTHLESQSASGFLPRRIVNTESHASKHSFEGHGLTSQRPQHLAKKLLNRKSKPSLQVQNPGFWLALHVCTVRHQPLMLRWKAETHSIRHSRC